MLALLLSALVSPFLATPAAAQEWSAAEPIAEPTDLPPVPEGWTTVNGTFLRVHGPENELPLLLRLARHGSERLPELAETLQVPIGTTIHVYVAPTDAMFRRMQPGRAPSWADATTWPGIGAVFLRAPSARGGQSEPLEQVFDHELVHVLVGRAFAPNVPPTWLQEGIAQLLANEVGPEIGQTLVQGSAGGLVDLSELDHGFPADPGRARLAYAESADFVAYVVEHHGDRALPELLRASAGGAGIREATYRATGQLFDNVEADWRSHLPSGPMLQLASLASGEWMWGFGALALIGAGVRRRREFHRRVAEMEAEEQLLDSMIGRAAPPTDRWTL
ncbi:MAG: hypothetical protein H6738_20670 [Alphaproteobacteria bacterium]|nr:hypothetical protein [Alphaproteobacteria bacterium]MCB9699206.1 hypothetical protein [Alphaproteobacteria bacterium]